MTSTSAAPRCALPISHREVTKRRWRAVMDFIEFFSLWLGLSAAAPFYATRLHRRRRKRRRTAADRQIFRQETRLQPGPKLFDADPLRADPRRIIADGRSRAVAVRAPTARTVHAYGERPGPPLAHQAPGLFWGDADREQGRTQGTRSIAPEEGSKRLRRHHRPQLNRLTESHRALRQRLR